MARGRSNAVQQRVRRVQEAGHSKDSKELSRDCIFFKHQLRGRDAARSALRPLPVLHHEDGTPCLDALDRSFAVSNLFAKLEAGLFTTMPELFQSCIQRQQVATCRTTHRELLVSRLELEQAFRSRKRGRAMGESGLSGELFALALAQMASMCSVLFFQNPIYVQEPFRLKGSRLCTFYKKTWGADCCGFPEGHKLV